MQPDRNSTSSPQLRGSVIVIREKRGSSPATAFELHADGNEGDDEAGGTKDDDDDDMLREQDRIIKKEGEWDGDEREEEIARPRHERKESHGTNPLSSHPMSSPRHGDDRRNTVGAGYRERDNYEEDTQAVNNVQVKIPLGRENAKQKWRRMSRACLDCFKGGKRR